jgi:hypothetical protein
VPRGDFTGAGERLQIFYKVATAKEPATYTFTSAIPQRMFGAMFDFFGVDPKHPIDTAAGQINATTSGSVPAPSITPTEPNTMLVFVGATNVNTAWRAPSGMTRQDITTFSNSTESILDTAPIGIATKRWPPATATGTRTATISSPNQSIGELISLNYAKPIACPAVKILTHKFKATSDGLVLVRIKCAWTARCTGAFEGVDLEDRFPVGKIAASDFSIGAGQTRTIPIALTKQGAKALKAHRILAFDVFVWVFAPAGQPVVAGAGAYKITA